MNKEIEIQEGYAARIEGNKVILEQKESEDERIRTRLIALVEAFGQGTYKNEMLAYLEKQKEQKPAEWSEREKRLMKALQITNARIAELVEENYNLKEQKQEWSEEDDYMQKQAIRCVNNSGKLEVSTEEIEDWLKSLRPS